MMHLKQYVYVIFLTLGFNSSIFSMEMLSVNPGTRAMAMAGAFTAQADDSSAIWYNAAALIHYNHIQKDFTFEVGQRNTTVPKNNDTFSSSVEFVPKFVSVYSQTPYKLYGSMPIGVGASYFSSYKAKIYIDAPQSLVTDEVFGDIEANYHQVSSMINLGVHSSLSVGATFDFLWLSISCLDFKPCVDNGPSAIGMTLSGMYDLVKKREFSLKIGGVWRSKAKLRYRSTPSSGISTVLTDYTPDRPDSKNIGISLQVPTQYFLINSNLILESTSWVDTAQRGQKLSNYQNIGASVEILSMVRSGKTYAIRFGSKLINNRTNDKFDAGILSLGLGYEIKKSHLVDVAFEHKKIRSFDDTNIISLSYSWQKL